MIELPMSYGRLQHTVRDLYKRHQSNHEPSIYGSHWNTLIVSYDDIADMLGNLQQPIDDEFIKLVLDRLNAQARFLWFYGKLETIETQENDPNLKSLNERTNVTIVNMLFDQRFTLETALDKVDVTRKELDKKLGDWAKTDLTDDGKIQPLLYAMLSA